MGPSLWAMVALTMSENSDPPSFERCSLCHLPSVAFVTVSTNRVSEETFVIYSGEAIKGSLVGNLALKASDDMQGVQLP